jgi:hypothetical protein
VKSIVFKKGMCMCVCIGVGGLVGLGFKLRTSVLIKQAIYSLSHTSSPFYSGYLEMGSQELFAQAGFEPVILPISAS